MGSFERYLSLWVGLPACSPAFCSGSCSRACRPACAAWSSSEGSHINLPIAVLIWLMIYPMMLKIDFGRRRSVGRGPAAFS